MKDIVVYIYYNCEQRRLHFEYLTRHFQIQIKAACWLEYAAYVS